MTAWLSPISALQQFPESKLLLMVSTGPSFRRGRVKVFLGPVGVNSMIKIENDLIINQSRFIVPY